MSKKEMLYEVVRSSGWHIGTQYDVLNGNKDRTISKPINEVQASCV